MSRPSSSLPLGERIHCHTCEREISAVAASSIRLLMGTQPTPASQAPRYWMPTFTLVRRPASVMGPSGSKSSSSEPFTSTSSRRRSTWLGLSPSTASKASMAIGTRPGWATHVPSWPSPASRSLSARTFAMAASLASGSFLIGICAAMPPMAWAPRLWQVLIASSEYARMKRLVMVTRARSASTKSGSVRNFLMHEKM